MNAAATEIVSLAADRAEKIAIRDQYNNLLDCLDTLTGGTLDALIISGNGSVSGTFKTFTIPATDIATDIKLALQTKRDDLNDEIAALETGIEDVIGEN